MTRPKTKILVDGGDPQETLRVKELLGFVDGQTTNPSLVANNRQPARQGAPSRSGPCRSRRPSVSVFPRHTRQHRLHNQHCVASVV